jgi:hypothetical protein
MRMSIYIQDELGERVKAATMNISAVCQQALGEELDRQERRTRLTQDMERVEVPIDSSDELDRWGAFYGRLLYEEEEGDQVKAVAVSAYLTRRHRIAVYDDLNRQLHQYDNYQEFARSQARHSAMVAKVAEQLGERYVEELDI